jgi:hypothetical protein
MDGLAERPAEGVEAETVETLPDAVGLVAADNA